MQVDKTVYLQKGELTNMETTGEKGENSLPHNEAWHDEEALTWQQRLQMLVS